jgi:ABC-type antimicrobial peptide transport system permease subunit
MEYARLVLKNLFRNRRRTILTTISIAISLFIFSALVSLPTFANQVLADTASSVRIACRTKMGFVVVATIGLVAINTAAMSIRERRSEIAVMRSIGFPSRVILMLLVAESMLIAVVGALTGCAGALVALKLFSVNADAIGPFATLRVPPAVIAEALVLAILIGLVSAYLPAIAAVRRKIVDVLRVTD